MTGIPRSIERSSPTCDFGTKRIMRWTSIGLLYGIVENNLIDKSKAVL